MDKAGWKRKAKILVMVIITGSTMYYLFVVLLASVNISTFQGIHPRTGHVLPKMTDECRNILAKADLSPRGTKGVFREYANIWLWDGANTLMYDESVLEHAACLNYLLQECVAAKERLILVIYNRQTSSEVLLIRNYASINPSKRR